MRRTLQNALDSRIPVSLNIKPTDSRCVGYINSAIERLMTRGKWWGMTPRYRVSVTEQLLTLPPQFATMLSVAVAQVPITIRSHWYEYGDNGLGVVNDPSTSEPMIDVGNARFRGSYPSFKDITSGHKARLICDVAADIGATALVLGYDSNGNWVRTAPGGVYQDGETVTLAQSPGTLTATTWSQIVGIQLTVRKGQVWLYDWDGSTNTLIGQYQYWETNPSYSRYLLPTIPGTATQVDLIGALNFIPVTNPTDYLIISNLEALRLACMAVRAEEEHLLAEASVYMNGAEDKTTGKRVDGAITLLEDELQHYVGDGTVPTMTVVQAYGQPGVEALL